MVNNQTCRLTGGPLDMVLDLGRQPLGNGFLSSPDTPEYFYDLRCGFNKESKLFQLIEQPAPELMFHDNYAFFSGTSQRMTQHFKEFAEELLGKDYLSNEDPFIVELGSNDGILLRHFSMRGIPHLGVEPSGDVADVAEQAGVQVVREFFDRSLAARIRSDHGAADVIVAANVMCHIPALEELAGGIASLLKDDGVLVFEDPYLGDVIRQTSYDQIYDEHVFLFSGLSVQAIFATVGMELIDLQPQLTHGGSMRYTLAKVGKRRPTQAVDQILADELALGLDRLETFNAFALRVANSASAFRVALEDAHELGKSVAAYGATSKSTTIYNYAGIGPELISRIYDNTPGKIGKFSPGVHIPIVDELRFSQNFPDVAFLAAWNHQREIVERYQEYSDIGGQWLTHVPTVHFIN